MRPSDQAKEPVFQQTSTQFVSGSARLSGTKLRWARDSAAGDLLPRLVSVVVTEPCELTRLDVGCHELQSNIGATQRSLMDAFPVVAVRLPSSNLLSVCWFHVLKGMNTPIRNPQPLSRERLDVGGAVLSKRVRGFAVF